MLFCIAFGLLGLQDRRGASSLQLHSRLWALPPGLHPPLGEGGCPRSPGMDLLCTKMFPEALFLTVWHGKHLMAWTCSQIMLPEWKSKKHSILGERISRNVPPNFNSEYLWVAELQPFLFCSSHFAMTKIYPFTWKCILASSLEFPALIHLERELFLCK